jgi:hypothetical protein
MLVTVPIFKYSKRCSPSDFPAQVCADDAVIVEACCGYLIETVPAQRNTPKTKSRANRMKPPRIISKVWRRERATVNTSNGVLERLGNTTSYDCGLILKSSSSDNGCFIERCNPKGLGVSFP